MVSVPTTAELPNTVKRGSAKIASITAMNVITASNVQGALTASTFLMDNVLIHVILMHMLMTSLVYALFVTLPVKNVEAQQILTVFHVLMVTSSHRLGNALTAVLELNMVMLRVCVLIAILLVQSAQDHLSRNVVLV